MGALAMNAINSIEFTNSGKDKRLRPHVGVNAYLLCFESWRNSRRIFKGGGIFRYCTHGRKIPCAVSMLRYVWTST